MSTTCKLADSCQQIIDGKDREIERKKEEIRELESEIEECEKKEKYYRIFLIIQAGLLMVAFQVFDL